MRKPITWVLLILWVMMALMTAVPGYAESDSDFFVDDEADIFSEGDDPEALADAIDPSTLGIQRGTELVIGTPIAMNGHFGTEMWGNNSADMDVRAILHGYETVCMTEAGLSLNETVLTGVRSASQGDGSVAYTLQFSDDLYYNEGTKITARDYAFYFLLSGAPEIEEIGGTTLGMKHIAGYEAYQAGETNVLGGVRVLSDSLLEVRITGASFPYFYGLALLNAKPYPISVIAPGCEVADDGQGVYIRNRDPEIAEPLFTAALLRETLLDREAGYQYNPKVTSGPYALEWADLDANEARFVVNEYFAGNFEGQKPHIEKIALRHVTEEGMLNDLVEGRIGLLNKVTDGTAPQKVRELAAARNALVAEEDAANIQQGSYLRTGFGFLAFACESSPTDSAALRRAIAMSFDRDAFVEAAMPGSALRTYGYYGMGQWMASYAEEGDEAAGAEAFDVAALLPELDVPTDIAGAAGLLEAEGWNLNERGEPYASGDGVRHRDNGGTLEPLVIRCAMTEENRVAAQMKAVLSEALSQLGIELVIAEMPFPRLLAHYYRQAEREYDMFFMASNFSYIFDPYYDFNTEEAYQGSVNTTGLRDAELMALGLDMRETEPQDLRGYAEKWLRFQKKFVELMPMVPLYSNVYYDFFTDDLGGYDTDGISSWSYSILYAYLRGHQRVTGGG